MLRPRRWRFGVFRSLAFVLLVTVGGMPLVSLHAADDDPACTGAPFRSADGKTVGGAQKSSSPDGHCPVCHAMRAFRIAPAIARQAGVALAPQGTPQRERGPLHRISTDNRLPTRGPPITQL